MQKNFIVLLALFLISCGGGGSSSDSTQSVATSFPSYNEQNSSSITTVSSSNFSLNDKNFLLSLFENEYLWYDSIDTNIDLDAFDEPNSMIDALRYKPLDIWSYAETYEEYEAFATQTSSGNFGFRYNAQTFQILNIVLDSPAHSAGLQRGDIITHINDQNITYELLNEAKENLNVESTFKILRNQEDMTLKIAPSIYNYSVTQYDIFVLKSEKLVGWLRYDQFSSSSITELENAFNYFKLNKIDELIIDLRYNGGGSLTITSILMDKIAGYNNHNKVQFTLQYNDKLFYQNSHYRFEQDDNSLSTLSRVFLLTTDNSASASEILINSLKPYMQVYTIGSTTHGKPVGMSGRTNGEYIYWLINFLIVNKHEEGAFFGGIAPTCEAQDNFNYPRYDINENMLKEAFYYILYGECLEDN
ncbi:MAG: S41 family peptidase [Campylobacterota bacterium]|nr:S41 family peptidase [Campylobacterota bacterium]